jgi:hypothetical protein
MKKILAILSIFVLAGISFLAWIVLTSPDVNVLIQTNPKTTALMEQRASENGTKLQPLRSWITYKQISIHLRNAVLVSEDSAFFQHDGLDWNQIRESAKRDWAEASGAGRQHHHPATGQEPVSVDVEKPTPESTGTIHCTGSGTPFREGTNPGDLSECHRVGDGIYGINAAARGYLENPRVN